MQCLPGRTSLAFCLALVVAATLTAQSPIFATFGPGCAGSMPVSHLHLVTPPVQGGTLRFDVDNLPANAALVLTGLSRTSSVLGPLPLDGTPYGAPGCFLRVRPDTTVLYLGAANQVTFDLAIPAGTGLVGLRLFHQALVPDASANAAGAVVSDAAEATVGLPGFPLNMVPIAPGTFQMGSTQGTPEELPVHTVDITQPFWMGKHEVTQAEYQALMANNPSTFQGANLPVETVSWNDAIRYCEALTAQEAAAGRLPPGYQYRLPTEAEWEYCCRAGTTTEWNVGASPNCSHANVGPCVGQTIAVGSYAANAWGLHDMHGNVAEWCLDHSDGSANYPVAPVSDPFVTSGPGRIYRGGCWDGTGFSCRSAYRYGHDPANGSSCLGLRVVLAPFRVPGVENLVPIAPGSFLMGSNAATGAPYYPQAWERPVHQVTIARPFWMGKYEVTQAEYLALVGGTNHSFHQGPYGPYLNSDDRPVERVTWTQAMAYCAALTAQEVAAGRLPLGYQYRLPTEAEWEYCCRAGTTTEYNTGTSLSTTQANFGGLFAGLTWHVGFYQPNAWGLYDMHGNVGEWCLDHWDGSANYPAGPVSDPVVTSGSGRVSRGGDFFGGVTTCRSARRYSFPAPSSWNYETGFRIVLAPV